MHTDLFTQLLRLLAGLDVLQREMAPLLKRKLLAIASLDLTEDAETNRQLIDLDLRFRAHLRTRGELLVAARKSGIKVVDVRDLLKQLKDAPGIDRGQWHQAQTWMHRVDQTMQAHRRDSATNWVVTQRVFRHLARTREIIARGGEASPTTGFDHQSSHAGGTLLDASV